jgi:hypothetical protein
LLPSGRADTWTRFADRRRRRSRQPIGSTTTVRRGRHRLIVGQASPTTGSRGFDRAKTIDGIKRHVQVDSAGILVLAVVTEANVATGSSSIHAAGVFELTNGWNNYYRRIHRHHETTLTAHERFLKLSHAALPLARLDRSQLFDTV